MINVIFNIFGESHQHTPHTDILILLSKLNRLQYRLIWQRERKIEDQIKIKIKMIYTHAYAHVRLYACLDFCRTDELTHFGWLFWNGLIERIDLTVKCAEENDVVVFVFWFNQFVTLDWFIRWTGTYHIKCPLIMMIFWGDQRQNKERTK